jgi:hypothetical protein
MNSVFHYIPMYCDVQPNNINFQSELLWLCASLVVITDNANTLFVIAVLLNNANTMTDIS